MQITNIKNEKYFFSGTLESLLTAYPLDFLGAFRKLGHLIVDSFLIQGEEAREICLSWHIIIPKFPYSKLGKYDIANLLMTLSTQDPVRSQHWSNISKIVKRSEMMR